MRRTLSGGANRRPQVLWDAEDRHRQWSWTAVIGLVAAAALGAGGVPPIPLHPPWHYVGVMDPACGGTRAMVAAARGRLALSWRYNPAAALLLGGAVAVVARHLLGAVSGRWLTLRLQRKWVVAGLVVGLALLAVNQQSHAALLR